MARSGVRGEGTRASGRGAGEHGWDDSLYDESGEPVQGADGHSGERAGSAPVPAGTDGRTAEDTMALTPQGTDDRTAEDTMALTPQGIGLGDGGRGGTARPRRRRRVLRWSAMVLAVLILGTAGAGYLYYQHLNDNIKKDDLNIGDAKDRAAESEANAAGLYVILDLHWSAPGTICPTDQNWMADTDHSIAFWTSIAGTFKGYPNVLFELFNEPYAYWLLTSGSEWKTVMQGGTITQFVTGGTPYQVLFTWKTAGMQQMLNAVRATGRAPCP